MRSIKPGRGLSGMGAVGAVVAAVFGVIWTIVAVQAGAPFFFPLFGVIFVILAIVQGIYHYHNATGKNRFSEFDITEDGEEPDPFHERFGNHADQEEDRPGSSAVFCPYCGAKAEGDFEYCPKCGKKLPD